MFAFCLGRCLGWVIAPGIRQASLEVHIRRFPSIHQNPIGEYALKVTLSSSKIRSLLRIYDNMVMSELTARLSHSA